MKAYRIRFTTDPCDGPAVDDDTLAALARSVVSTVPGVTRAYVEDDRTGLLVLTPAPSPTVEELHRALRPLVGAATGGRLGFTVHD